ncbi:MAG: hypothetical protein ACRC1F_03205 [Metamycoplasmataceae bacterium]
MPNENIENEIIEESPPVTNEGSQDLSFEKMENEISITNQKLEELLLLIKNDLEQSQKEKEESKKLEEELKKEESKKLEEDKKKKEDMENKFNQIVEGTTDVTFVESIDTSLKELVFLEKLSFVGVGIGIALVTVMIFQNSFKGRL